MALIAQGAEATLELVDYIGIPAVRKVRHSKGYRIAELDRRLRRSRTRKEAKLLHIARRFGVRTPVLLAVWPEEGVLVMEYVHGLRLKELTKIAGAAAIPAYKALGQAVARLHLHGIVHGDLTTSNVIVPVKGENYPLKWEDLHLEPPCEGSPQPELPPAPGPHEVEVQAITLIDMGLGEEGESVEQKGVDLHCLRESIDSTHYDIPGLWDAVANGYMAVSGDEASEVMKRVDEIALRGRYR